MFHFAKGYYVYVGSAFGPGGIRARLGRHLSDNKTQRWHIDFLRAHTEPVKYVIAPEKRLEHVWANELAQRNAASMPVTGFGSSDCRCTSHLFFSAELDDLLLTP